ncbi:sulfatase [Phycisphaerales bacterium AB-hyl4]|uniref:Sulfatase n=1 Tax=Natronomicrosphaera hydrolytica TaxID=3242702 RepID=A0ABV4U761_9BACT
MADDRPNLLLVFADQLRADAVGCYGNEVVRTPTIDALARQGVRAQHCFANYPCCGPMRASMLTAVDASRHGVIANDLAIRTDLPTLGTTLRDAGYRTGYVGKWHLDGVPRSKYTPPGPRRLGFDDYWAVCNCAHDYFRPYYYRDTPQRIDAEGYEPIVQTELAIEFLQSHREMNQPFGLVVSWGPPHDPYPQVPEQYRDLYDPARLPLRPNVQPATENALANGLECRRTIADYYAATTALDEQLDRLLSTLNQLGMAENTLVVFTSDHGDMLWSHGWMKKQSPYAESVHVPLVLRGPSLPAGETCDALVGLMDLTPTLLGLLGVEPPDAMHWRDRSDVLRDERHADEVDAVLLANPFATDEARDQQMPEWRGLRTHTHTYVETEPGKAWLLFSDIEDPYQMRNLVGDPTVRDLQRRLSLRLAALLQQADDPFLPGEQWLDRLGLTAAWQDREARVWQ